MSRQPFRIDRQPDVDKTALLYEGEEAQLRKISGHFSDVESSETYPAFKGDFKWAVHFYDSSKPFASRLREHCEEKLPKLSKQAGSSGAVTYTLRWTLIMLGTLLGGYILIKLVSQLIFITGQVG